MKKLLEWIRDIIIALVIAMAIMVFIKPMVVQEESMKPSFYDGDYVIVGRQAYNLFGDIKRGDVIVFKSELTDTNGHKKNLIKRVIALPGDTIEIKDGMVYLNGSIQDEDYIAEVGTSGEMDKKTVPSDRIFVMGDNRGVSEDSRSDRVGFVDVDSILGKVIIHF